MNCFDVDPLASWQSDTKSFFSSRRGTNEPTVLKIDDLLKKYKEATTDGVRLGVLEAVCFTITKWLSAYSGSRSAAAKRLLNDAKAKRSSLQAKGVIADRSFAMPVSAPDPSYPEFLARNKNPGDKYFTLGMLKNGGLGKDLLNTSLVSNQTENERDPSQWNGLTYMNENERRRFLVNVKDGLLYYEVDPGHTLDTRTSHIKGSPIGNRVYIYVMDGRGRIFSAAKGDVEHHSSFLAGNPAAAAGMMRVIDGKVEYVNAQSGHYCPSKDEVDQFIAELQSRGVDTSKVEIEKQARRIDKQTVAKARGIHGVRLYPTGPREEWC